MTKEQHTRLMIVLMFEDDEINSRKSDDELRGLFQGFIIESPKHEPLPNLTVTKGGES